MRRALIAGGGTVGHLNPGIAIARALAARGWPLEGLHFVGAERGVEASRVPAAGFTVTLLPGRGIQRRLTPANLGAVWGLLRACGRAAALLRRLRPAVVVSTGGYASVPCALAAVLARTPVVVAEQNAAPGAANRLVGRFAKACAVSFPGVGLPRAVLTGNPVGREVLAVDRVGGRAAARARLGIPAEAQLVVAFGGSLGARRINEAVLGVAEAWRDQPGRALRHAIGERDWAGYEARARAAAGGRLCYQALRYEEEMPLALAAADVIVARAGATTVAELTAVGAPALLVPLPGAPSDHQTANARALVEAGAAVLVPDAELSAERLAAELDALLGDPDRLARMGKAAAAAGRRDAAERVADLVERWARPAAGPSSTRPPGPPREAP
ncbi:MAG: undecaprenyldiphospho-muramoylpentapeptide beta-N-acetylglucosaminyltransferase [Acidimicrobiales bacterium]